MAKRRNTRPAQYLALNQARYVEPWPGSAFYALLANPDAQALLEGKCVSGSRSILNLNGILEALRKAGYTPMSVPIGRRGYPPHHFLYEKLSLNKICTMCERRIPVVVMERLRGNG